MIFEQSNFRPKASWSKIGLVNSAIAQEENTANSVTVTILENIASGDKTAVQECLNKYGGLVWSLARRMLPDVNDAEDAVQEIFVEIWKNAARFDASKSSETTFIAMIARRRLIDRLRKFERTPQSDSIDDMLVEPTGRNGKEIYASVEAQRAAQAMRKLRPEQNKVLTLSIVEGYSHSEISKAMNIPLGTVKTHARRGLMEVRDFLRKGNSGKEVSA